MNCLRSLILGFALACSGSAMADSTITLDNLNNRDHRSTERNNWCTRWSHDPNQCEHTAGCEFDYHRYECIQRNVIPGPSECSYWDNDPWRCSRTQGCAWDNFYNTCEQDDGGSFPSNQCWRYDRDPRTCSTMRGCSWDHWSNRCVGGDGGWDNPGNNLQRTTINCSSSRYRYQECEISGTVYSARLIREYSSSDCVEGRTWGTTDRGVWVDQGCRADFAVTYRRW